MSDWNDKIINEFRTNNGVVGGPFAGAHLLLVTTIGAKSGEKRTTPVMYFPQDAADGADRIIVASKAGAPEHPAWFHNLRKNPDVHIEAAIDGGIDEYDAVASVMPTEERDRMYAEIVKVAPGFGEYEKKTTRKIPLVVLTPKK